MASATAVPAVASAFCAVADSVNFRYCTAASLSLRELLGIELALDALAADDEPDVILQPDQPLERGARSAPRR